MKDSLVSCDYIALATQGVQGLNPYLPGKPIEELERELGISNIVKLASNENPLGPGEAVKEALQSGVADLSRYPDGNAFLLKAALAEKYQVDQAQLIIGNGSNDVLELLGRAYLVAGESEVIYTAHSFAVYPLVTQACGAKAVVVPAKDWGNDLDAMADAITDRTRLIFVANPNNPTGTWSRREELLKFLDRVPEQVIVVLDEAYAEYVTDEAYPDGIELLKKYDNLIVTRTFSKAYGLASLRVGYSISNLAIADVLNRVRQPFNVNSFAQLAAVAALSDQEYLQKSREINSSGLEQLENAFNKLGLYFIPSVGNFISVDFQREAMPIYNELLKLGVIVRPVANYKMPTFLRVSVGLESENQKFIDALQKVL